MKNRLKLMESRVVEILQAVPEAKDNDNLLLAQYIITYSDYKRNMIMPKEFDYLYSRILELKIGTLFKSIERTRRKVQELYPDLRGKKWIQRHQQQEEFINYALGRKAH
jgi:ABC-type uncharacterized transport system involved in gliding motility auxiliary subunit